MARWPPRRLRWPRSRVARVVVTIVALALLAGGLLAGALTFEPARAWVWQTHAADCGAFGVGVPIPVRADPATARARAQCLADAWARCRPAVLAFSVGFLDGTQSDTLVIEPAAMPWQSCQLADRWSTDFAPGPSRHSGTEVCAGLAVGASELLVRSCGARGDVHASFKQWPGYK
jgi:hypothetical protein